MVTATELPTRWKAIISGALVDTADFMEVFGVLSITTGEDAKNGATLLFDPDRSLEERVIAEQFAL